MPSRAPIDLRCEYLEEPLGIGVPDPRLSFRLDDDRPDAAQSAYRILAAASRESLEAGRGELWDTGRVESSRTTQLFYAGAPLPSRQRVFWRVQSFDRAGEPSPWSAVASFEMGLLERTDWSARWIGTPVHGTAQTSAPVPLLRRPFRVERPVAKARLYCTALGLYRIELNGRRIGDAELSPGWTDYRKRVRVQVYDLGSQLLEGENVLGAWLGDGWYCGFAGLSEREGYGDRPKLLAQLEVELDDGSTLRVVTDRGFRFGRSPILESDLFMGEVYDARQEQRGFSTPGFDDSGWQPVEEFEEPEIALDWSPVPPIRATERLAPVAPPVERRGDLGGRRLIYDLGQNLVGRVRLRVRGRPGATVTLRHAEALDGKGELYTENLREARQTDRYTLRGDPEGELYEPSFTFHGFRYVELSGRIRAEDVMELSAVVLHSDLRPTGAFACSDPRIERLQRNIVWSQRGNFLDVPTDCPQRNERLGWTGDAQVFAKTAAFNLEVAPFLAKWLVDLSDAQAADGRVPPVAPVVPNSPLLRMDGGPAWADAIVICPWTLYRCYGDLRVLEERYPNMVAFVGDLERRFPQGIRSDPALDPWGGFGDWLAHDNRGYGDPRLGGTPRELIGTAFFAHSAGLLSAIARALGREHDAARHADLAARVRRAFRERFVTAQGRVAGETQTGYVLALQFDLLQGEERKTAGEALVRDLEARGDRLSTGFVGTPYLLHVLTAIGRLDLAYRLLFQTRWPSWLYPVTQGATTIWERWDGWTEERGFQDPAMNSFNHYAYGSVGEWLYETVAGLALDPDPRPERNAYRWLRIRPRPPQGEGFPEPPLLTHASARLDTMHGRSESAWRIEGARFVLEARVPPNCRATVELPDGSAREVGAGLHRYEAPLPRA
jgi:alpha-L-rhamnosidase